MSRETSWSPRRMTEPLPNCLSIWLSAALSAFILSSVIVLGVAMVCLLIGLRWVNFRPYIFQCQ